MTETNAASELEARRFIPKGYRAVRAKHSDAVAYVGETNGVPYGIGYCGRRVRHDWHHRFRSHEERAAHVTRFFESRVASIEAAKQRRADKSERKLEVGDILVSSWGYEQTNVDYYQVTRLVGKCSVALRPIAAAQGDATSWASGKCKPAPNAFTGDEFTRRASAYDGKSVRINSVSHAFKTDPDTEHHWSSWH